MHHLKEAYLRLLLIELDDLEADIEMVDAEYRTRHDQDKISNYIFQENIALAQRELFGVDGFRQDVAAVDPAAFASLDELVALLRAKLETRVRDNGLPGATVLMIERKLDKVRRYVES